MAEWEYLPPEIRRMILEAVAATVSRKRKGPRFADYAVVCREWQDVIEKFNFRSLQISPTCLGEFDRIVRGDRRKCLKRIWLRIELPAYSKKLSRRRETDEDMEANDIAFTNGIWFLFESLSTWDIKDTPSLALELSAYSPSDRKRYFEKGNEPEARFEDSDMGFDFIEVPDLRGSHGLPEVEVITDFCILRRNFRNVSPRALLTIFSSLPRLSKINYEPWEQVDAEAQDAFDIDFADLVLFWPSTLKKVSLFEHQKAHEEHDELEDGAVATYTTPMLSRNLSKLSLHMEEFSASYLADARDFFEPFAKPKTTAKLPFWENLHSLTLTSSVIWAPTDPELINDLLQAAGNAAKNMPKLRSMELYNTGKRNAGVFLYLASPEATIAGWESTWEFSVSERVKQAWRAVARKHTRYELNFAPEVLLRNYKGPVKFIHGSLATFDLALHPISSHDMLKARSASSS